MNRNVILLSLCQALLTTGNVLLVSVNGLIGRALAPADMLVTLPVALQYIGLMAATIPASLIMGRIGRKKGFYLGNAISLSGAGLCLLALQRADFVLFCVGALLLGVGVGFGTLYRFAATEVCPAYQHAKAISLVMAGGIVAAIVGPSLALYSRYWIEQSQFMGSFIALLGLYILTLMLLFFVQMNATQTAGKADQGEARSLHEILTQPIFILAVVAGICSYAVMSLVMTATPLAMERLGYDFASTTSVIKWHVLGMFAPSFFTGRLIQRFGAQTIIFVGTALIFICIVINLIGQSEWHFWSSLLLLGIGWNFMFISTTHLLTESHRSSEKAKTQAANEFMVFGFASLSGLSAGWLEASIGWHGLNLAMLPLMVLTIGLLIYYSKGNKLGRGEAKLHGLPGRDRWGRRQ